MLTIKIIRSEGYDIILQRSPKFMILSEVLHVSEHMWSRWTSGLSTSFTFSIFIQMFTQSNYFITSCSFHMPRGSVWICRLLKSPLIRCQKKKIEDVLGTVLFGRTRTSESFVIGNSFLPLVICTRSSLPQDIYLASPMMIPNSVKRILVPQRTSV